MTEQSWEQPPESRASLIAHEGVHMSTTWDGYYTWYLTVGGKYSTREEAYKAAQDFIDRMNLR